MAVSSVSIPSHNTRKAVASELCGDVSFVRTLAKTFNNSTTLATHLVGKAVIEASPIGSSMLVVDGMLKTLHNFTGPFSTAAVVAKAAKDSDKGMIKNAASVCFIVSGVIDFGKFVIHQGVVSGQWLRETLSQYSLSASFIALPFNTIMTGAGLIGAAISAYSNSETWKKEEQNMKAAASELDVIERLPVSVNEQEINLRAVQKQTLENRKIVADRKLFGSKLDFYVNVAKLASFAFTAIAATFLSGWALYGAVVFVAAISLSANLLKVYNTVDKAANPVLTISGDQLRQYNLAAAA